MTPGSLSVAHPSSISENLALVGRVTRRTIGLTERVVALDGSAEMSHGRRRLAVAAPLFSRDRTMVVEPDGDLLVCVGCLPMGRRRRAIRRQTQGRNRRTAVKGRSAGPVGSPSGDFTRRGPAVRGALRAVNARAATAVHSRAATTRKSEWPGGESNTRHANFQSAALPTELPGQPMRTPLD